MSKWPMGLIKQQVSRYFVISPAAEVCSFYCGLHAFIAGKSCCMHCPINWIIIQSSAFQPPYPAFTPASSLCFPILRNMHMKVQEVFIKTHRRPQSCRWKVWLCFLRVWSYERELLVIGPKIMGLGVSGMLGLTLQFTLHRVCMVHLHTFG